MRATINDVAKLASVSKATVSRVMNGKGNVGEEVKAKVLDAIKQLNFEPSGIARSLANRKTGLVGLIIPDITNPYFPMLARGVEDAAHRHGYTVLQCNTDNDAEIEYGYIKKLNEQEVEGIVLVSSNLSDEISRQLMKFQTPIVFCDRVSPHTLIDSVTVDNYLAAFQATEYLISLGHEKIMHIGVPAKIESAKLREMGYLDACARHGLEPILKYGPFAFESGYQIVHATIEEEGATAIFAANDLIALGAMKALAEKGYSVPDDVAVLGCDDIFAASICSPQLSTIVQPAYQMGVKALDMLYERMTGYSGEARKAILGHELIIRESSERKS